MYWSCSRKVCKFYIFFYIFGFIKKKNLMSVVIL